MFSIVIPAHNESSVIERCLNLLTENLEPNLAEIIVVCNGCTDDTAEKASKFKGVTVIDIATASKVVALNAGDQAAQYYPIAYLDADIAIPMKELAGTVAAINNDSSIKVAAPKLKVDLSHANGLVRSFYDIWMRLPYFSSGQMVGSGLFILSEDGRKRFQEFPNIISDDGYVRSLFNENERRMISEFGFKIFAPRTLKDLIKIKTRVRFGNMEVAKKYPSMKIGQDNGLSDIIKLVISKPSLLLKSMIYIFVQLRTKQLSRARMAAADFTTWERDDSSRA